MKLLMTPLNHIEPMHLAKLLKLRSDVFVVEQACIYSDIDSFDWDTRTQHLYFLTDSDDIAACARVLTHGEHPRIGRLAVDKGYRQQGLARKVMEKAMQYCEHSLKKDTILISAQTYLTDFYESLGFKVASSPYLEDGIEHVDMHYKKNAC